MENQLQALEPAAKVLAFPIKWLQKVLIGPVL